MNYQSVQLTRRAALGLGAAAVAGLGLAACSSKGGSTTTTSGGGGAAQVPNAVTPKGVTGSSVSSIPNVPTVQTQYPASPFVTVSKPPASGDTITTLQLTYSAPPPPASQNQWLTEYQKRIGATMNVTLMNSTDIAEKTQAVIAGGNLPDIFYCNIGQVPAALTAVQQGAFLDLSPYIGGDKVKDYPNLGGLQQVSWKNSIIGGKLVGVPYVTPLVAEGLPQFRLDWQQKLGLKDPTNADEMYDFLLSFATKDPDGNGKKDTWTWGAMTEWDNETVLIMFGVPNNWRKNDDGSFTYKIETDEYKQSLEFLHRLYQAGAYHPNAVANGYAQEQQLWGNGQIALFGGTLNGVGWPVPIKGVTDWYKQIWSLFPCGYDGGPTHLWASSATFGFYAIPAKLGSDKNKVEELLRVMDYWAAPFGSDEYTFLNFGIEGHNFTRVDGAPVVSTNTTIQSEMAYNYLPSPGQQNLFLPGHNDTAMKIQKGFEQVTPGAIPDPSLNLISQTQITKGAQLTQMVADLYRSIVSGREPMSELPNLISKWRQAGGDQMRKEFEAAAKQQSGH